MDFAARNWRGRVDPEGARTSVHKILAAADHFPERFVSDVPIPYRDFLLGLFHFEKFNRMQVCFPMTSTSS